jgi:hypothetical protein
MLSLGVMLSRLRLFLLIRKNMTAPATAATATTATAMPALAAPEMPDCAVDVTVWSSELPTAVAVLVCEAAEWLGRLLNVAEAESELWGAATCVASDAIDIEEGMAVLDATVDDCRVVIGTIDCGACDGSVSAGNAVDEVA